MDDRPTLLVGRVSDVGPTYVVLGETRIELDPQQGPVPIPVGRSVAVMAVMIDGRFVGGSIVGRSMRAEHVSP